jgi:molybdate-binding protein/transcriptional regulator with XRE-family HTH domain
VSNGPEAYHGVRLRLARQARGLSQQQLANVAGVSRQAISLWESGGSDPSLRAAFALASALGMTIEELFGPGERAALVAARPVAQLGSDGARVTLASVRDGHVALPLRGVTASRGGFRPAGGLAAGASSDRGQSRQIRPIGPLRPVLVVAGCDPALPLLEAPLGLLDPPVAFSWWPCPSREALRLAAGGLVHVAGTHLRGPGSGYNIGPAAEMLARGGQVIGFCSWQEGLALRPELAEGISGVADAARCGLRLVNREPGAEARSVLDRELAAAGIDASRLPGYGTQATGHLEVAATIAAGLADAGIASEPAALAYGLAFLPLTAEHFDLVIPAGHQGTREVQGLLKVLSSAWLLDQLASVPGYDPARCGEHIAALPPHQQRSPRPQAQRGGQPRPDDRK